MPTKSRIIETDVLVVGAGAAGCRAALEASVQGANVTICTKGKISRSGSTCFSGAGFAGFNAADGSPENTKEDYYNDIIIASAGTCDEQVVKVLTEEAIVERDFLERKGVPFAKSDKTDEYVLNKGCFSTRNRAYMISGHGHAIIKILFEGIKKQNIRMLEDTMVTKIIVINGRAQGVIALNRESEIVVIHARAVILAAGGACRLFKNNMNPPDVTGDGYALAYQAGATLTNMEFMQYGLATVYPDIYMIAYWLFNVHPLLRNAKGEAFLPKYLPAGITTMQAIADKAKHFPFSCQDNSKYVDIAIHKEILAGNCTEHGGVILDFRNLDPELLNTLPEYVQQMWIKEKQWLNERDIDIEKVGLEIAIFAQAVNGGPLIDVNGQTDVDGLFSCGENAAGPHGADRLGGNMLVASQVFGRRAGKAAAARKQERLIKLGNDYDIVQTEINRITQSINNFSNEIALDSLTTEIQKTLWENLAVVRSANKIKKCLDILHDNEAKLAQASIRTTGDTIHAMEIQNMLTVGYIMCQAALCREETRGSHCREDYPEQNDKDFKKNIFIQNRKGKLCVDLLTISDYKKNRGLA